MNYTLAMNFEWDAAKSEVCFLERGFDFAFVLQAFLDPNRVVHQDVRRNYGEDRYQVMGQIEERLFVVVYTPRQEAIRIVSARKANHREVKQYEDRTRND